jgi:hypothetical protein
VGVDLGAAGLAHNISASAKWAEERSCFPKQTKEEHSLPFAATLDSADVERIVIL